MNKKLPKFLYFYFWDTNAKEVDVQKNAKIIIERILDHGNDKAVAWLFNVYTPVKIKKVLKSTRNLSPRSATFWTNYFNLNKKEILCLKPSYLKIRRSTWPY